MDWREYKHSIQEPQRDVEPSLKKQTGFHSIGLCGTVSYFYQWLRCNIEAISLPAEGTVSLTVANSLFLFLGKEVLQRASKCACMGVSIERKLH